MHVVNKPKNTGRRVAGPPNPAPSQSGRTGESDSSGMRRTVGSSSKGGYGRNPCKAGSKRGY